LYDALIAGAGPAGASAALILGRARRSVLVCDDGTPRNETAVEMHGFIGREGSSPVEFLTVARDALAPYETIELRNCTLSGVVAEDGLIRAMAGDQVVTARSIVLATGMMEQLPGIRGLSDWWGRAIFSCPYCDGWEVRDRRIAIYGEPKNIASLAQELYQWSRSITICGFVSAACTPQEREWLEASGVETRPAPIVAVEGSGQALSAVLLEDGERVPCEALFLCVPLVQQSPLAVQLGCTLSHSGRIVVDAEQRTSVPRVYAAGDTCGRIHQIAAAVASGASAGIAVNDDLTEEDARVLIETKAAGARRQKVPVLHET
jgi:thioredoxin reductase